MTTPPLIDVPIMTAEELTARWAAMLEPPVFGRRSLWLAWLDDDGFMLPLVVPVDDVPLVPDRSTIFGLLQLHETVADHHLDDDGHLALALCRPGRPEITEDDDAWVGLLSEVLDDQLDATWSLHLAAGGTVLPLIDLPA